MEFIQEKVDEFKKVFYESQPTIESFEGCHKVDLYSDSKNDCVFYTHSLWDDEKALDTYRDSDFFKKTWSKTKPLFAEKARAYSLVPPA